LGAAAVLSLAATYRHSALAVAQQPLGGKLGIIPTEILKSEIG